MQEELPELVRLCAIMRQLRGPQGCPWDREQTLQSLKPCLLEETYELLDAMDSDDISWHMEELGDVLLQVVFQCAIREESRDFDLNQVAAALSDKLIRRHPHVFGDAKAGASEKVLRNWEAIKREERKGKEKKSALDGVPPTLPALLKAQRTQEKASRSGFDWESAAGARDKLAEEMREVEEAVRAADPKRIREELGDLLFAVVNYSRFLGVDAESALQEANQKFSRRFKAVEEQAAQQGHSLAKLNLAEMDALWDMVKSKEPE